MRKLVIAAVLLAGCSPAKTVVSGIVTLDGRPLDRGLVRFVYADIGPVAGQIVDGQFTIEATPGHARVEITSSRKVGSIRVYNASGSPVRDKVVEAVPARYNWRSELFYDVRAGVQEVTYALKSR